MFSLHPAEPQNGNLEGKNQGEVGIATNRVSPCTTLHNRRLQSCGGIAGTAHIFWSK
ncbi:hypothetical protein SBA2_960005 [Acidobacteriia bacterium SbA2]|nr:hypothetical protein SBA2_960005 [Acidobacteriia bacterium SbA2]